MQWKWWRHHQGTCKRSPADSTGDKMPPVTPPPRVSEAPLRLEIFSGPSLAGELSTLPRRPALYLPRRQVILRQIIWQAPWQRPPIRRRRDGQKGACPQGVLQWCRKTEVLKRSLKAPTYLWHHLVFPAPWEGFPQGDISGISLIYSNLQQPKADFSFQTQCTPEWRTELELNV